MANALHSAMSLRPVAIVLAVLAACAPEDPGPAPTPGKYRLEHDETAGSCAPGGPIGGSVIFIDAEVEPTDAGFTLGLYDIDGPYLFDCIQTDASFECTGPELVKFMRDNPAAQATMTLSAAGEWTSATDLEFVVTGAFACTGDAAACADNAADWEIELPCDMQTRHHGSHIE